MAVSRKKKGGLQGKGALVAAALFVLLGLYVWLAERNPVREPGEAPPVSEMVGMKPEDVTHIELLHASSTLELAKVGSPSSQGGAGGGWRVEKPIQARADETQVKQVLDTLLTGKVDQIVAEKVSDVKQYGLDRPALQVTLEDAKGHRKVLQTGLKDVRGFSVYARAADKPELFLLSSFSIEDLQKKKADDLRDKTLLAIDPNTITRLMLQSPAQTVRVEKQGAKWQETAPRPAPADTDEVKTLLDQIKSTRIDKFEGAASNLARYGLAKPSLTVTVTGPAGDKGLLLGKNTADGKGVYAMRQGEAEVFQVPKNVLTDLSKQPGDLRDKTLLSFKRDDAKSISITTPAQTLELAHAGKEWRITKPTPGKPKEDRLSSLLFTLEVVKGSRVVEEKPADLAKYGLDKPEVRAQVVLPAGTQELLIGKKVAATGKKTAISEYYARSSSQEAVFTVPDFTVTDLKVNPADLAAGKK